MEQGSRTLGLAYLGPEFEHKDSLHRTMNSAGIAVVDIADSLTWIESTGTNEKSQRKKIGSRASRARQQLVGTQDEAYLRYASDIIDRNNVKVVIAYWGTLPLPDIKALKRLCPAVNFILNVLCHPLGLTTPKVALQDFLFRNSLASLDGLILPNTAMQRYFQQNILGKRSLPILVSPPFRHSDYFAKAPAPAPKESPNIVFLGRMDWKQAQPSDNVGDFLMALMIEGIDVHFSRSTESSLDHARAHPFVPVPPLKTPAFAAQFDASLIVYNLGAAKRTERFDFTVPDRLISSVCIGIPIAIPSHGFSGCREYLSDLGAVIEYNSPAHLAQQLRDRPAMQHLRSLARSNSQKYHAESHQPALLNFLQSIRDR